MQPALSQAPSKAAPSQAAPAAQAAPATKAREETAAIIRMLETQIDTKGFQEKMKLSSPW
jgi:hypothetical protein